MKSLSQLLKEEGRPTFTLIRLEPPTSTIRAAKSVSKRWPDIEVEEPVMEDHEQLIQELKHRIKTNDWSNYYWQKFNHAACALFDSVRPDDERHNDLFTFIFNQMYSGVNRPFLRVVFRKYLQSYSRESERTRKFARKLNDLWQEMSLPIETLVRDFKIFLPDDESSQRIASFMRGQNDPYEALLSVGMEAPHGPGLMAKAHSFFVASLTPTIAKGSIEDTKRLFNWLGPEKDGHPTIQGRPAKIAINALLEPWQEDNPSPSQRNLIEKELLRIYNDPRLLTDGVWNLISDSVKEVILKWLTETTFKTYFDIVTNTDSSHMWTDRKQLWFDLFKEGEITQTWCALSVEGIDFVKRHLKDNEARPLSYGENCSRSLQDQQKCLLYMFVQGRWVVEGSHSFPTWVFPRGKLESFNPYVRPHTCEQIRNIKGPERPERIVHLGDWRNKVLQALMR